MARNLDHSLEEILDEDLDLLVRITRDYHKKMGYPDPLLMCLCQGAALHYVNEKVKKGEAPGVDAECVKKMVKAVREDPETDLGVKDFDVWSFFRHKDEPGVKWQYPERGTITRDFAPTDRRFEGKKVDILGRSIVPDVFAKTPEIAVAGWLAASQNGTPMLLRKKAAVVIWPKRKRGTILWPVKCV